MSFSFVDNCQFVYIQLLYYHWSKWTNFYKSQPLEHVRKYFGEKVGIYFTWVGKYVYYSRAVSVDIVL